MQVDIIESGPTPQPAAPDQDTVTDSQGRVLKLRELSVLDESRLVRMLGAEAASNQSYMTGYVLPAVMVASIDGDPLSKITTMIGLEGQIQRLGKPGLLAVLNHLTKQAMKPVEGDPAKNSPSTPAFDPHAG